MLVSQLDDYLYDTGRVKAMKELFDNIADAKNQTFFDETKRDKVSDSEAGTVNSGGISKNYLAELRQYDDCGFLKLKINVKYRIADHGITIPLWSEK